MSWAVTHVPPRHWVWTVWTDTERRTGISGSQAAAEQQARRHERAFYNRAKTSSVEHPARDSAEQRTPGTPDPPNNKEIA